MKLRNSTLYTLNSQFPRGDGPYAGGASATFSKDAVIFEDGYWNTPTNWVGRHSTTTELHCVAHGGPYGGHVRFDVSGAARLNPLSGPSIPFERDVSAGKRVEFSVVYEGAAPSAPSTTLLQLRHSLRMWRVRSLRRQPIR